MMYVHHTCLWLVIACYYVTGPCYCVASLKKASCSVHHGRADCSHLSLTAIPSDLPGNITSLDMSHNRLRGVSPASLHLYPGLLLLDVSYNSITVLDNGICQTLPLLQKLNIEHNEVRLLKKEDFTNCTNLSWLNMASNRLKLQGEAFSALQVSTSTPVHNTSRVTTK